ncbi:MAG TPA: hypothetical protein VHH72_03385 [Solirubrobacterales bacterium]|jgi:hypothetical protein|nr:hypothetical protein [Solirubrobacterales bacterium]
MAAPSDDLLARQVYVGDRYKPFGELTAEDARALAAGLRGLSGGGLEAKVMPVKTGWQELAKLLELSGSTVADLEPEVVARFAERVWVTPPGGTLLP